MAVSELLPCSPSIRSMSQADWEQLQHEFLDCLKVANPICEPDWMHAARLLREYPRLINVHQRGGWSALHQAIFMANSDAVNFFLSFGADPHLETCHSDQDPITPKHLAEKLRDQVPQEHPNHETILEHNRWPRSKPEKEQLYEEIVRLLRDSKFRQIHDAIAHSYIVAMSTGDLSEDAKQELRDQWRLLDPTMSLIEDVVEKINEHYDKTMNDFIHKLDVGYFIHKLDVGLFKTWFQSLQRNAPFCKLLSYAGHGSTSPSLGALICWPFRVCAQDVRHALDDLVPTETVAPPRLVSFLASLLTIWDGAETRLAFQTLAMKRSWSSWSDIRSMSRADIAAWFPLTLYGTIIFCKLFSHFAGIYVAYDVVNTVYTLVFGPDVWAKLWSTIWLGIVVWLGGVGRAYCDAMQPRIPMLTVRLHRDLISKGKLVQTDYLSCEDFNTRYEQFSEGGSCTINQDSEAIMVHARMLKKRKRDDVSNQEDIVADASDRSREEVKIQKMSSNGHLQNDLKREN